MLDNPGFIPGSRASLMMDLVTTAMALVLPVLFLSIWLVKSGKHYRLHRQIQSGTGAALLIVVIAFELHVRLHGWQERAAPSPYFETALFPCLYVHLVFAILAVFFWGVTLYQAFRNFPRTPRPTAYSPRHRVLAWTSVFLITATALTGWLFYFLAFMAV